MGWEHSESQISMGKSTEIQDIETLSMHHHRGLGSCRNTSSYPGIRGKIGEYLEHTGSVHERLHHE
jgi:hypothetical protein